VTDPNKRWLGSALAVLTVAVLTWLSRVPELRHPLGRDASAGDLSCAIAAARNFTRRGFLESGGVPVAQPLPVQVAEGIAATEPPLLSWGVFALSSAAGLDERIAARWIECAVLLVAAVAVGSIAAARGGTSAGFAAAAFVALSPIARAQAGSTGLLGMAAAAVLACALDRYARRRSPWALVLAIAAGCAGAFANYRFVLDSVILGIAGMVAFGRGAWRPAALLALAAPALLAVAVLGALERLVGGGSLLAENLCVPDGGARMAAFGALIAELAKPEAAIGSLAFLWLLAQERRGAAIPAGLLVSAAAHGVLASSGLGVLALAPVVPCIALGWGFAVGSLARVWRVGGALLAAALALVLLAATPIAGPADSRAVEALGAAVRTRVAFGESFATNERSETLLSAETARPAVAGIDSVEALRTFLSRYECAHYPCTWFFLVPPQTQRSADPDPHAAMMGYLRSRFWTEREGPVFAFDLRRPREGKVAFASADLAVDFNYPSTLRLFVSPRESVASWRVEVGAKPLATATARTVPASDTPTLEIPVAPDADKLYVRAIALDSNERESAPLRETFFRVRSMRKLRSKALALVPLAAGFLALMAVLAHAADRGRVSPNAPAGAS
jgi:hypothetical protein